MGRKVIVALLMLGAHAAFAAGLYGQPVTIRGVALPSPARSVLGEIMRTSGVSGVRVTSTYRTPTHQVRVMGGFIRRHGLAAAYRLYGPEGDAVIAQFETHGNRSRAGRRQAMLEELLRVLPAAHKNGRLMHTQETHYVFDVAVRSLPADRRVAFARAARKHSCVLRFLGFEEGEKGAFHLEVDAACRR